MDRRLTLNGACDIIKSNKENIVTMNQRINDSDKKQNELSKEVKEIKNINKTENEGTQKALDEQKGLINAMKATQVSYKEKLTAIESNI